MAVASLRHDDIPVQSVTNSGEDPHASRCSHGAQGRDATQGGNQETSPQEPGPQQRLRPQHGPEHVNSWFCGFDCTHHQLHLEFMLRPYPDNMEMDGYCNCLPGTRCQDHTPQDTVMQATKHAEAFVTRMASEEDQKVPPEWLEKHLMRLPRKQLDRMMPWQYNWEGERDCLNLAATVLYMLFTFCLCHLDWSIGDFDMDVAAYYDNVQMLRHTAVRPGIPAMPGKGLACRQPSCATTHTGWRNQNSARYVLEEMRQKAVRRRTSISMQPSWYVDAHVEGEIKTSEM